MGIPVYREPASTQEHKSRSKPDACTEARSAIRRSHSVRYPRTWENQSSTSRYPSASTTSATTPSNVAGQSHPRRRAVYDLRTNTARPGDSSLWARAPFPGTEVVESDADNARRQASDRRRVENGRALLRDALSYERPGRAISGSTRESAPPTARAAESDEPQTQVPAPQYWTLERQRLLALAIEEQHIPSPPPRLAMDGPLADPLAPLSTDGGNEPPPGGSASFTARFAPAYRFGDPITDPATRLRSNPNRVHRASDNQHPNHNHHNPNHPRHARPAQLIDRASPNFPFDLDPDDAQFVTSLYELPPLRRMGHRSIASANNHRLHSSRMSRRVSGSARTTHGSSRGSASASVGALTVPLRRPRPASRLDGLGDRQRSPTPETDVWDTLLTTIPPDTRLPSASVSTSFATGDASASASASASHSTATSANVSAATSLTTVSPPSDAAPPTLEPVCSPPSSIPSSPSHSLHDDHPSTHSYTGYPYDRTASPSTSTSSSVSQSATLVELNPLNVRHSRPTAIPTTSPYATIYRPDRDDHSLTPLSPRSPSPTTSISNSSDSDRELRRYLLARVPGHDSPMAEGDSDSSDGQRQPDRPTAPASQTSPTILPAITRRQSYSLAGFPAPGPAPINALSGSTLRPAPSISISTSSPTTNNPQTSITYSNLSGRPRTTSAAYRLGAAPQRAWAIPDPLLGTAASREEDRRRRERRERRIRREERGTTGSGETAADERADLEGLMREMDRMEADRMRRERRERARDLAEVQRLVEMQREVVGIGGEMGNGHLEDLVRRRLGGQLEGGSAADGWRL